MQKRIFILSSMAIGLIAVMLLVVFYCNSSTKEKYQDIKTILSTRYPNYEFDGWPGWASPCIVVREDHYMPGAPVFSVFTDKTKSITFTTTRPPDPRRTIILYIRNEDGAVGSMTLRSKSLELVYNLGPQVSDQNSGENDPKMEQENTKPIDEPIEM